jgi:hypothetical protein
VSSEVELSGGGATRDRTCGRIRQFGTTGFDGASAVAVDASGNVFVAGRTAGTLPGQLSAGGQDAFLCKYDPAGAVLWTRQFGGPAGLLVMTGNADSARAAAVDAAGNVYVVGSAEGVLDAVVGARDAFVRKFDAAGNVLWTRQFGSASDDEATAVAVDASGNVLVVGTTFGALPGQMASGNFDAFARKYDANGTVTWTRQFGTPGFDEALGVAVSPSGDVYVVGSTFGTLGASSDGARDVYVRRFSSAGAVSWTRQFGSSAGGDEYGTAIAVDVAGAAYVAGVTDGALVQGALAGGLDAFVARLDSSGTRLWTRQFGSPSNDGAAAITVDVTGQVLVAGDTLGALPGQMSAGSGDAFARAYDAAGAEAWTRQFGSTGADTAAGIASRGGVFVVGQSFGALPGQASVGNSDAFLVRLAP